MKGAGWDPWGSRGAGGTAVLPPQPGSEPRGSPSCENTEDRCLFVQDYLLIAVTVIQDDH